MFILPWALPGMSCMVRAEERPAYDQHHGLSGVLQETVDREGQDGGIRCHSDSIARLHVIEGAPESFSKIIKLRNILVNIPHIF
jgi:hypothetical protein